MKVYKRTERTCIHNDLVQVICDRCGQDMLDYEFIQRWRDNDVTDTLEYVDNYSAFGDAWTAHRWEVVLCPKCMKWLFRHLKELGIHVEDERETLDTE